MAKRPASVQPAAPSRRRHWHPATDRYTAVETRLLPRLRAVDDGGGPRLGFAARFVTGYIYVATRDGKPNLGGGSTHAWCQVYLPGAGWVEFDPTNGIVGNRGLIRVAVARDPAQAVPLSGSCYGKASDDLGMTVQVNVTSKGKLGAEAEIS